MSMKIFVDENIPLMTVRELVRLGHEVSDIRGTEKEGSSDHTVWDWVQRESRLLITTDKGFARRRNEVHSGILIICLKRPNRKRIHQQIIRVIQELSPEDWSGRLVVVRDAVQSTWRSGRKD